MNQEGQIPSPFLHFIMETEDTKRHYIKKVSSPAKQTRLAK